MDFSINYNIYNFLFFIYSKFFEHSDLHLFRSKNIEENLTLGQSKDFVKTIYIENLGSKDVTISLESKGLNDKVTINIYSQKKLMYSSVKNNSYMPIILTRGASIYVEAIFDISTITKPGQYSGELILEVYSDSENTKEIIPICLKINIFQPATPAQLADARDSPMPLAGLSAAPILLPKI